MSISLNEKASQDDEKSLETEILNWVNFRSSTIKLAKELQERIGGYSYVPSLSSYSPQTIYDIEIQQFNLYLTHPKSIKTEEELAMWILEKNHLNRKQVCRFLMQPGTYYYTICFQIASKICSLDIGHHFVDGLKYFIPVCGIWDLFFLDTKSSSPLLIPENEAIFRNFIDIYTTAHLTHSKEQLKLLNSSENTAALVDFGWVLFDTFHQWNIAKHSITICLSDYLSSCKKYILTKYSNFNYDLKILNDLFITATSIPITVVTTTPLPSYYMHDIRQEAEMMIYFAVETLTVPHNTMYHAKLTMDCLYLFREMTVEASNTTTTTNNTVPTISTSKASSLPLPIISTPREIISSKRMSLFAAIPLQSMMCQRLTIQNNLDLTYIHLLHNGGEKLPVIYYQDVNHQDYKLYPVVEDIRYETNIFLSVHALGEQHPSMKKQEGRMKIPTTFDRVQKWIDVLEECYWENQELKGNEINVQCMQKKKAVQQQQAMSEVNKTESS